MVRDQISSETCVQCSERTNIDPCTHLGLPDCIAHFFTHIPPTPEEVSGPDVVNVLEVAETRKEIHAKATKPVAINNGLNGSYYEVEIKYPTKEHKTPYLAECNDIIEALNMTPHEYNIFKSVWRKAAARLGNGKKDSKALYDAQKCLFASQRMVILEHQELIDAND